MHGLEQILWLHAVKGTETQECLLIWLAMAEALLSSLWSPPSIASKTFPSPASSTHLRPRAIGGPPLANCGKNWQIAMHPLCSIGLLKGRNLSKCCRNSIKLRCFKASWIHTSHCFNSWFHSPGCTLRQAALMSYIRILLGEDLFDVCNRNLRSSQIFARVGNKLVWKIKVGTIVPLLMCAQGHQSLYVVKSQAQSTSRLSRSE